LADEFQADPLAAAGDDDGFHWALLDRASS
jgi:hypothetical protein